MQDLSRGTIDVTCFGLLKIKLNIIMWNEMHLPMLIATTYCSSEAEDSRGRPVRADLRLLSTTIKATIKVLVNEQWLCITRRTIKCSCHILEKEFFLRRVVQYMLKRSPSVNTPWRMKFSVPRFWLRIRRVIPFEKNFNKLNWTKRLVYLWLRYNKNPQM